MSRWELWLVGLGAWSRSRERRPPTGSSRRYLVLFVNGVPPAEESSLRSRGDAYRDYQRRTSRFVPLPRSA